MTIFRIFLEHLVFNLILLGLVIGLGLQKYAISIALGAIVYLLPFSIFSMIFFREHARAPHAMVQSMYVAELVKWVVLIILLVIIFCFVPIIAGAFFIGYGVNQVFTWLTPTYRHMMKHE